MNDQVEESGMPYILSGMIDVDYPDRAYEGFALLANVRSVEPFDEASCFRDLVFRRATEKETGTLRAIARGVLQQNPLSSRRNPYETKVVDEGSSGLSVTNLSREDWRYCVAAYRGSNIILEELADCSILTPKRIILGPRLHFLGAGMPSFSGGNSVPQFWNELECSDEPLLELNQGDYQHLADVHEKYQSYPKDRFDLKEAIKQFKQLDRIPAKAPLRFLGYVSILESLVTHQPDPKDPHDSLTRQMRKKMFLIGRRANLPIPYDLLDPKMTVDNIWKKLYGMRSKIAHGSPVDFKKEFACLHDHWTATQFVASATASVMRQTLEEPDLLADLREC